MIQPRGLFLGGVRLRFTTRWRARDLDDQLVAGADPMQSDELSLRVGQLGSSRTRRRLACSLRGVVALAERAYPIATATPRVSRAAVCANRELLLELAERLSTREPLGVRGLAIASKLIDDRKSPLYSERADRSVAVSASEALVPLHRGAQDGWMIRAARMGIRPDGGGAPLTRWLGSTRRPS